jgi:hypothetical protein
MTKVKIEEGTCFAVPLSKGGLAIGVATRIGKRGVLLGYFFGPRRKTIPRLGDLEDLRPADAIRAMRFGDLGLQNAVWTVVGKLPSWNASDWPVPEFGQIDKISGLAFRVRYEDISAIGARTKAKKEEVDGLPEDGLAGYEFVEEVLDRDLPA